MEKRIFLWSVVCAVFICAAGCQKSDNYQLMKDSKEKMLPIYEEKELEEDSALLALHDVYKSGYICEEWTTVIDSAGAICPGGILCRENEMIISDRKNNCILKTDYEGNIIKKAGGTGSGAGEFLSPGAVAGYEDSIYIIDQGNQRIQVLDKELDYVEEIKLKDTTRSDPDYQPQALAVCGGEIYVAGLSLRNPVIDKYKDGKQEEIGDNFAGAVSAYKDRIYAINGAVRYYDKENDTFGAATNGPEWLFTIEDNRLRKSSELPYGFGIADFVMDDKGIIACSESAGAIFILNMNGKYEETIAYIEGLEDEQFPQISENGKGEYYIALPNAGKIFRCYKER